MDRCGDQCGQELPHVAQQVVRGRGGSERKDSCPHGLRLETKANMLFVRSGSDEIAREQVMHLPQNFFSGIGDCMYSGSEGLCMISNPRRWRFAACPAIQNEEHGSDDRESKRSNCGQTRHLYSQPDWHPMRRKTGCEHYADGAAACERGDSFGRILDLSKREEGPRSNNLQSHKYCYPA